MLKKIDAAELELGMYIHRLEGNWLKHSFWKTKFLLTDPEQLEELRSNAVEGVYIDIEKGADVGSGQSAAPARRRGLVASTSEPSGGMADRIRLERMQMAPVRAPTQARPAFDNRSTAPIGMAREVGHSRAMMASANRVLSGVFEQARLGKAISAEQIEPVIEDLFASVQRNPHAFNGLMRIRRENSSLYAHGLAVSALMIALGRHMGLDDRQVKDAGLAGLIMDVGMGHLPIDVSTILDDLSEEQRAIVQTHTTLGYDFVTMGGGIPDEVSLVCLQHHERCDGSGYPKGLVREEIGLLARMAAICDVYDSLTSDRPHRPRVDPSAALEQMRGMPGDFDSQLMAQFIESLGVYPIGSVVRLTNGRLALVVDQNSDDCACPRVWTFYDCGSRRLVKPEDLDLRFCKGRVEIVGSDDAAEYGIENFPAIREMVFNSACKALH